MTPRRLSGILDTVQVPGQPWCKSALQLIAEAPAKYVSFYRHAAVKRHEYFDDVAAGRHYFDADLRELASFDDVTAALKRGEVWSG